MDRSISEREAAIRQMWDGDFTMTAASHSAEALKERPIFVIQKHDSLYPHYDLRLEINKGVLKSWVLPEDPFSSVNTGTDAIITVDHYLPWAYFEGSIHKGKYGKGTVMVWDIGKLEIIRFSRELEINGYQDFNRESTVLFSLYGKKLKGDFTLTYNRTEKTHIYWELNNIDSREATRAFKDTIHKSALSGASMESIKMETWREKVF